MIHFSDDELFSDTYKIKVVDNVMYEVYGKVRPNECYAQFKWDVSETCERIDNLEMQNFKKMNLIWNWMVLFYIKMRFIFWFCIFYLLICKVESDTPQNKRINY